MPETDSLPGGHAPPTADPLLEVRDLWVEFQTRRGVVPALRGVSYVLPRGRTLAVVGESGSGKSVTARAIMGILPPEQSRIVRGEVLLHGQDLLGLSETQFRQVRGREIAIVFQDALSALNPVLPVGFQIAEGWRRRGGHTRAQARQRAIELMEQVGIPAARSRVGSYPHEFSGGMRQRVMIATALAQDPDILIADEPTTALDVTIQAQILRLLADLQREREMGLIMITHDMGVVANIADQIAVMFRGEVVETGACAEVLALPGHPYTRALLKAIPRPELRGHLLPTVSASWNPDGGTAAPGPPEPEQELLAPRFRTATGEADVVLRVTDLVKHYPAGRGAGSRQRSLVAVDGVNLELRRGRTLGLVGESGSGKSTVARILVAVESPTSGSVQVLGRSLHGLRGRRLQQARRDIQLVFQDPYTCLDPRMSIGEVVREPLLIHPDVVPRNRREDRVRELLDMVGLPSSYATRLPHQLSGGQRQRVGIARALALEPKILVLDEPVSALDVSVQAQIVNLLSDLQVDLGLSYVFIAHDLGVVAHMSDDIAVMYLGRIVEQGSFAEVFHASAHPFTEALMAAVPEPDPAKRAEFGSRLLAGDTPSPLELPSGCRFSSRCWRASVVCLGEPELAPLPAAAPGSTHLSACHHPRIEGDLV